MFVFENNYQQRLAFDIGGITASGLCIDNCFHTMVVVLAFPLVSMDVLRQFPECMGFTWRLLLFILQGPIPIDLFCSHPCLKPRGFAAIGLPAI